MLVAAPERVAAHLLAVSQQLVTVLLATGELIEAIIGHLAASFARLRLLARACSRRRSDPGTAACAWRPKLASRLAAFPARGLRSRHDQEQIRIDRTGSRSRLARAVPARDRAAS